MIIKRDKEYWALVIGILVCLIGTVCIYCFGMKEPISVVLAIHSPVILFYLSYVMAYGRTFILTEEGCSVCFMLFKRTYTWEEFKIKRVVSFSKASSLPVNRTYPYRQYVVFSTYRLRPPRWLHPVYYNCLHPWSFVYINFDNPDTKTCRGRHYEVSEDEFREKMRLWNVVLEE